ncbi:hypothetical protein [Pseudochryseolinea flava]|uniref:Uncharacterized protein n=1 Tax=Pseudochryseolinea flava TaxID=2059302 RepID=A0A364Y529_9BACT|nr:hypothetical protein [Pseudochryseolinea flava]RAW01886.1 hypothetical protein DQQ10_09605 [Pseudochryseolinea flava]
MRKLYIILLLSFFVVFVGYYTWILFSTSTELISNDLARVTIKNESGHEAKLVQLQHGMGKLECHNLKNEGEVRFVFQNLGENSYSITAILDNGDTIRSKGVYFEIGYRGTETIMDTTIVTENNWNDYP